MFISTLHVAIFICVFSLCQCFPGKILGPGTFIFQSFEHCDPPLTEVDMWLTSRKFNRTTNVIDLKLSTPWPLSDNIIMEIKTASKKDGGYKDGSFYLKGPFCHTLKTLVGDVYNAIIEAAGVEDCPMPGDLEVTDFYLDSDKLNDQILYGEYRARIHFFVEEQLKGCYLMYMNLVPKED